MKVYRGKTDGGRKIVTVDDRPLGKLYAANPRRNVDFDWGTQPPSPGAVHLAEALIADCTGEKTANPLARAFANEKLSELPPNWEIKAEAIEKWLEMRVGILGSAQQAYWTSSAFEERATSHAEWKLSDFPIFPNLLNSLRERIKPDELAKQGFPRPKEVRLSRNTDSTGEEAFYVYLVFSDKTPDEALEWEKIEPMVSWVRDLIWTETGERLWPYVKVKRQKQLAGGLA